MQDQSDHNVEQIADMLSEVIDRPASCAPVTEDDPDFDLATAYKVSARIRQRRQKRGEIPVGWKIGFTNRTIWETFGVHEPIWGPVYDTTTAIVDGDDPLPCSLTNLSEPKIEPEIVFRLAAPPAPGMDEDALLGCIDGIALGFELVQSPFPDWKFRAPDTVAAGALHGALRHRPFVNLSALLPNNPRRQLESFSIALTRNGEDVDLGKAENVLGGPLSALKALVDGLAETPLGPTLKSGDVITTGTLTGAFDIKPGETWSTRIDGLPLANIALRMV